MTTIAIIALCIYALDRIAMHAWTARWQAMHVDRFSMMGRRDELDIYELEARKERADAARDAIPGGLATYGKADALAQLDAMRRIIRSGDLDDELKALDEAASGLRDRLKKVAGDAP